MSIKTDITLQDWNSFVRFLARRATRTNRGMRFIVSMMMAAGVAAVAAIAVSITHRRLDMVSFLAGALVILFWFISISRVRLFRIEPEPGGIVTGPRTISLTEEGIRLMAEGYETLFRWPVIRRVEATSQHLFVMVDANAAIITPLKAFASDAERDQFLDQIKIRILPAI